MRWRYFTSAVLCGFLGFIAQFVGDKAHPAARIVWFRSDLRSDFHLVYMGQWHLGVSTPYLNPGGTPQYAGRSKLFEFHPDGQQEAHEWQQLWLQLLFLQWLQERGELAVRTSAIIAVLGASFVFAADGFWQSRKAKKEAAV